MSLISIIAAIAIYSVSTVLVTELAKKWLYHAPRSGRGALVLSWAVGLVIFALLHLAGFFPLTAESVFSFIVLTGAMNGLYKAARLKEIIGLLK